MASDAQFFSTHDRTSAPLADGCLKAHAARQELLPHGHASTHACPALHDSSARQLVILSAHLLSPHWHFAGQPVLLQSGNPCNSTLDAQFFSTHARTSAPFADGCLKAHAARQELLPHGHASTHACPALHDSSARQLVILSAHPM